MALLAIYVVLVAIGESAAVGLGYVLDRSMPDWSSLVFIVLVFGVLFAAWPLAVRLTDARD